MLRLLLLVCLLIPVIGCGGDQESGTHTGAAHGEKPALPAVPVTVAAAVNGSIASYYTATATLEPDKQADILARVAGVILDLGVEEGDFAGQGDTLLYIQDEEYRHRLKQATAEEAKQRARFERVEKLIAEELVSTEEFDGARSDLLAAEAARGLAALELSYTRVIAPFAGRVVRRFIDPGQMVSNGISLFTLADTRRLLARVHVPAKEFRNICVDQRVELTLDSSQDTLQGTIMLISPIIDPTSGTIKVTVEITAYPPSIRPGDFAEVRIVTDLHASTVLVPKIAVLTEKGDQVVYVAADSTAERRLVEIGFQDEKQAEITDGVSFGEEVVVQGQRSLEDGQPLKIHPPAGHEESEQEPTAQQGDS